MYFPLPIAQLSFQAEYLRAGVMAGTFFVLAIVTALLWTPTIGRIAERTTSSLDDLIFRSVRSLVLWALILGGVYSAVTEISLLNPQSAVWTIVTKGLTVCWILIAVYTLNKIAKEYARWKIAQVAEERGETRRDVATRVTFFRKVFTIVIVSIGALLILSLSGMNTTPLLTGGAVGGIVLGIALQDTLSNVFAGFFLNIDRPVKIGDLIKLEDKYEGYVEDVGWRYTRLRLKSDNLLIIPNNKLSQSTVINIRGVARASTAEVSCKVPFGSDLNKLAESAQKIAEAAQASERADREDWKPKVRFSEYGETTVTMVTTLRAHDDEALARVKHEFILGLHRMLNVKETLSHVAITTPD
ncbi:MAG TPA: mechanosensitive ion channel family protein [Fimbriimonas sp.]|nr:mechanosensitive ion channel family protein [Fimbriimonas sp.]